MKENCITKMYFKYPGYENCCRSKIFPLWLLVFFLAIPKRLLIIK